MPNYPQFTNQAGDLNDNGRDLANFLTANLLKMQEADADTLNTYPGPLKYLFHNHKVSGMTVEQFIRDNGKSAALNAWRIKEAVEAQEAQKKQVKETVQAANTLAAELESVKAQLAEALSAIKTLQEAKAEAKPTKKAAKVEATEEVEDESEAE